MKTAEENRKEVLDGKATAITGIKNAIESDITKAVKASELSTNYYGVMSGTQLVIINNWLKSMGYTCEYCNAKDQRDDSYLTINW